MSKVCYLCGKKPVAGRSIIRRGMAKKKGGVGRKITGVSSRVFYPNLQPIKIMVKGLRKTVRVCTKCLKTGKISRLK